jgi:hypothetical protein
MATDYYAVTNEIIVALEAEGLTSEATALRDVMEAGSTATEILMGIRWHLQKIDGANRTTNITTKRQIRELITELDRVLSE